MKKRLVPLVMGLGFGLAAAGCQTEPPRVVGLEKLDLSHMHQGLGKPQVDRSMREKPLSIGGQQYATGVGTHATSLLWVEVPKGAERFQAWVGVDDAAGKGVGSVVFRVYSDEKKLFDSGVMHQGDKAKRVDVSLAGVRHLALQVGDAGDGIGYDHGDWAEAQFVVAGTGEVQAMEAPREEAVVLTPKEAKTPRINGPRIFGVRPGHPVLFTVAATGEKPMTYSAEGLPEGVQIDQETGRLSGAIARPGEYRIVLHAKNGRGEARRDFRLVCGETIALTPHMGWNSWYVWQRRVSDKIMRDAADAMVRSGMIDHGYTYVNIDDCWAVNKNAKPGKGLTTQEAEDLHGEERDPNGAVLGNKRFPDMKALADYIHSKGLKAGIYTSPGPLTCAGYTGAYGHEAQDAKQFADWGFDFLKYDWCSYGRIAGKNPSLEAMQKPYRLMGDLLKQQDRDMILNLCQYGMGDVWKWGKQVGGQSWRTAGDLGGSFEGIASALFADGFDKFVDKELGKYGGPGGWNDPDYLLLGYLWNGRALVPTPLTPDEQYTQVSLWSLQAAPLIFSGDITRMDDFTRGLLCNDEVIDVDQDPLGKPGRRVSKADEAEVWVKDLEDGSKAVGLFNRSEIPQTVTADLAKIGLNGRQRVRDLWRQKDLGTVDGKYQAKVGRHGVVLLRLWPAER